MAIERLYIIPDFENIEESLRISDKWNTFFEYNDFFNPDLLDDDKELSKRIKMYGSLDRQLGFDVLHGVFYDICVNSSDAKIRNISRERMIKSMDIARELKCRAVVFHTNLIAGFEVPYYLDRWCELNESFYRELCAKYMDINIFVENMFESSPVMLGKLAQRMEDTDNFGVCYDVAHSNVHERSMDEWFDALSPNIRHLHINDNDSKADYHWCLGEGNIDWDRYFESIDRRGINAGLLVEVSGAQKQEKCLEYLKEKGYLG